MPVAAPADKRFRRAHVSPSRRRGRVAVSWSRLAQVTVLAALVTYGGFRAGGLVMAAHGLTVSTITISGNARVARGEVLALLDGLRGANMVLLDLEPWRRKLMASPWVADAAMRRVLPATVQVEIVERQPMAIGRMGGALYLIDERGAVIDEFGPNYAELDLPVVDGLAAASDEGAMLVDEPRSALAARLLASLEARPDVARHVSQIDVSDVRDAVVTLKGDAAMVRIGHDDFVQRLQSYLDLAPALRERIPHIDYVDLRFGDRVYVRPAGRREGALTVDDGP